MKSGKALAALVVYAVLTAVFVVLAFVIPFPHTGLFWTGFAFGIVALTVSLLILTVSLAGKRTGVSRLYSFPIGRVGVVYTAAQLALSFVSMGLAAIKTVPAWPFMAASIVLLDAAVIMTIAAVLTRSVITRQGMAFKEETAVMERIRAKAEGLPGKCGEPEAKDALFKLADAVRFSDPVSNAATKEKEAELESLVDELGAALSEGRIVNVPVLCKKAEDVLAERNRLCWLNK